MTEQDNKDPVDKIIAKTLGGKTWLGRIQAFITLTGWMLGFGILLGVFGGGLVASYKLIVYFSEKLML